MGILNVTPDSFSDGGQFFSQASAIAQAEAMVMAGVDIIDVGGESTRPGADDVAMEQELERVVPVIEAICQRFDTVVSIDSSKAEVIREACSVGAGMINDVRALREPGALSAALSAGVPVCLMHMQGQPRTMQAAPRYNDVLTEVADFLRQRVRCCVEAGIAESQILIDPGFGFGKNLEHNLTLITGLEALSCIAPVVAGLSRKRMLGQILGDDTVDRTVASTTAALLCIQHGAQIVRVHDVEPMVQALSVHRAVNERSY